MTPPDPGAVPSTAAAPAPALVVRTSAPIDPLFLSAPRVSTFHGTQCLTKASGFFFERDGRLFLVTSRHVVIDEPGEHFPDRIEIELHTDPTNLTQSVCHSIPLYIQGEAAWRQGRDSGSEIDVAAIEIHVDQLPPGSVIRAFTPDHLQTEFDHVPAGESLLVVGFPLGFHDELHHLPVVRHAVVASPFGIRFQGQGFFLTDARTHRGISGAAVVVRDTQPSDARQTLPWKLLGVHSARMDMGDRDLNLDESLGLNCAWYADILMTLTDEPPAAAPNAPAPVAQAPAAAQQPTATAPTASTATPASPAC
jgi:hypothetical protein